MLSGLADERIRGYYHSRPRAEKPNETHFFNNCLSGKCKTTPDLNGHPRTN